MNDITPKEAIANLNHLYGMVAPDIQRSLDVAIKALERPSGDCISREALKEVISKVVAEEKKEDERWTTGLRYALTLIDNAKTVEFERPQGEWKHIGGDEWVCSECGHVITTEGSWENPLSTGAYHCENCGAEMRGGAE